MPLSTIATLGYVLSPDRERVLLIHRNARPDDAHYGKYNGLGGKLDAGEDVVTCIRREVREEAGIECDSLTLRGTVNWPGFAGGNWFGFIFLIDRWHGTPHTSNAEGVLEWHSVRDLLSGKLNVWPGDRHFLPLVFAEGKGVFHGVMPYAGGVPVGWSYSAVED